MIDDIKKTLRSTAEKLRVDMDTDEYKPADWIEEKVAA